MFTSNNISLVHASELKLYFDIDDIIYGSILQLGRTDIIADMQRMFIYNYIIGNPDLHDENYGILYDPETFNFIGLSPCYDHNVAFQEGLSRATNGGTSSLPLDDWSKKFISNHLDILAKLKYIDLSEIRKYLTDIQYKELKERIKSIIKGGK